MPKALFCLVFLGLVLFIGCKFDLPPDKTFKPCNASFTLIATPDSLNTYKYLMSVEGNSEEVEGNVEWEITGDTKLSDPITTPQPALKVTNIFSGDGIYNITATFNTRCKEKKKVTTTITINTRLTTANSFALVHPFVHLEVSDAAITNDGIMYANEKNDIKIWNQMSLVGTLKSHQSSISGIALSPDEKMLYSAANSDTDILVWDTNTRTVLRRFSGHTSGIKNIKLSSDGLFLASVGNDNTIRVWNTSTYQLLRNFQNISPSEIAINGNYLLTNHNYATNGIQTANEFKLWNFKTGDLVWTSPNTLKSSSSVALSADGSKILQVFYGTPITDIYERFDIIDIQSRKVDKTIQLAFQYDRKIILSNDGRLAFVGNYLLNLSDLQILKTLSEVEKPYSFSPNGRYWSKLYSKTLTFQSVQGEQAIPTSKHFSNVKYANFSKDKKFFTTVSYDQQVKVWNVTNGEVPLIFNNSVRTSIGNFTYPNPMFSLDNTSLIIDGKGIIISTTGGNTITTISDSRPWSAFSIDYDYLAPDGSYFAGLLTVGNSIDNTIVLRDTKNGNEIKRLTNNIRLHTLAISHDSKKIASVDMFGSIKIWDVAMGQIIKEIPINGISPILKISSKSTYIASINGKDLSFWDFQTGNLLKTIPNFNPETFDFSSDEKLLVSGSSDGKVKVFSFPSFSQIKEGSFDDAVIRTIFSSDNKTILVVTQREFKIINL